MTVVTRTKTDGGAWSTTVDDGGGGGSLPAWWTINNTPGAESVIFDGGVDVTKHVAVLGDDPAQTQLYVSAPAGQAQPIFEVDNDGGTIFRLGPTGAVTISPSDPAAVVLTGIGGDVAEFSTLLALKAADQATEVVYVDTGGNFALAMGDASAAFEIRPAGGTNTFRVTRAGVVTSTPSAALAETLVNFVAPAGQAWPILGVTAVGVTHPLMVVEPGQTVINAPENLHQIIVQDAGIQIVGGGGSAVILTGAGSTLGFFGSGAVAQPTGVAVTAGGIHAALVTLGLIAA